MTAGEKKDGGSMLVVVKTETKESMFGQVVMGHGVIALGSDGGREQRVHMLTIPLTFTESNVAWFC